MNTSDSPGSVATLSSFPQQNSFQVLLVTDSTDSYVIMKYAILEWGNDWSVGVGFSPAPNNINATLFEHELSQTSSVQNLAFPNGGTFIFRVDLPVVLEPGGEFRGGVVADKR